MSPSNLDSELRRRAEKAAQAILLKAEAEAARIAADVDETIENRRATVLHSREDRYRTEARTAIAIERREAMRSLLLAKTALVERVLQRAKADLPSVVQSPAYRATLPHDVDRALRFVEAEGPTLRCPSALEDAVKEAVGTRPEVSVEAQEGLGSGFVLVGQNGTVAVDCTLETRLERLAPTLAIEIHDRIQGSRERRSTWAISTRAHAALRPGCCGRRSSIESPEQRASSPCIASSRRSGSPALKARARPQTSSARCGTAPPSSWPSSGAGAATSADRFSRCSWKTRIEGRCRPSSGAPSTASAPRRG